MRERHAHIFSSHYHKKKLSELHPPVTDWWNSHIRTMNKHRISQLPVLDEDKIIGLVSESSILNKNLNEVERLKVKAFMEEAPPIIAKSTRLEIIKQLLKFYSVILVKEDDKLIGLITKTDLINSLIS